MFLPRSQKAVFHQLIELARAKLNSVAIDGLLIQPRIIPLLHGPTGAGKTFLAELTAKELGARFQKVEIANWIPTGARDAEPTVKTIRELLLEESPLVLFIDEVDKFVTDSSTWARSVQAEVWATLDLSSRTPQLLIIGAGTWQDEHDKRRLGFSGERAPTLGGIPKELLHRFSHVFAVSYPDSSELGEIFRASGLQKLADEAGVALRPELHDWTGGMRSVERVCTELLLARNRRLAAGKQRTLEVLNRHLRPWSGRWPEGFLSTDRVIN